MKQQTGFTRIRRGTKLEALSHSDLKVMVFRMAIFKTAVVKTAVVGLLFVLPNLGSASAATPLQAALNYRSPDLPAAEREVAEAGAELGRARLGISGSVELEPFLEYREDLLFPENFPTLTLGTDAFATLDYTYDRPEILLQTLDLLGAQERLQNVRREGTRSALLAYADLLTAQLNLRLAEQTAQTDRRSLTETRARFAAGDATDAELGMAQLGIDSGQLSLDSARRTLENAQADAARYGIAAPARFAFLEFALPEIPAEATLTYQTAALTAQRSEALALQNSVYTALEEVRLGTRYAGEDYEFTGGIGLDKGRPTVGASARYRDRYPEAWTVSLGATIRLGTSTPDNFAAAQRDLEAARNRLADLGSLTEDISRAREEARLAARDVQLSVRDADLLAQRVGELETEIQALPGRVAALRTQLGRAEADLAQLVERRDAAEEPALQETLAGLVSEAETRAAELTTALQEAEQRTGFAEQELTQTREFRGRAEGNLYYVWTDYLNRVNTYLERSDTDWRVDQGSR